MSCKEQPPSSTRGPLDGSERKSPSPLEGDQTVFFLMVLYPAADDKSPQLTRLPRSRLDARREQKCTRETSPPPFILRSPLPLRPLAGASSLVEGTGNLPYRLVDEVVIHTRDSFPLLLFFLKLHLAAKRPLQAAADDLPPTKPVYFRLRTGHK